MRAISRGTPTSSMARFGSGVMTQRAEKSTRLPMIEARKNLWEPVRRAGRRAKDPARVGVFARTLSIISFDRRTLRIAAR